MRSSMSGAPESLDPVSRAAARGPNRRALSPRIGLFPSTRFMGSKEALLAPLWRAIGAFDPRSVLDLCSGSGVVGYMLKAQGCRVIANDYMRMATTIAEAAIANSRETLSEAEIAAIADAPPSGD